MKQSSGSAPLPSCGNLASSPPHHLRCRSRRIVCRCRALSAHLPRTCLSEKRGRLQWRAAGQGFDFGVAGKFKT
ncbi:hypothetical protein PRIPAC_93966 [Pristionchus pacificus]|uniref:Uncharacterized protein n=1 Tax=Pristionchus pacificus TaxID=54126 RepID=A0A2A6CCS8_PRIPA|nr:hypothetical protein PRIPAC_93966 [Pristionchus pacificus]|eukprot:PDM76035.1 hypothetical protein PRIPAC_39639 [Pristionchus pacificus]